MALRSITVRSLRAMPGLVGAEQPHRFMLRSLSTWTNTPCLRTHLGVGAPRLHGVQSLFTRAANSPRKESALSMCSLNQTFRTYSAPTSARANNAARSGSASEAAEPQTASLDLPPTTSNAVAYHLLLSAALVFLIIIVGGITRLTESGLSITEWNPGLKGMRLPQSEAEWNEEWDKYKQSPEFKMLNANMTMQEFKTIFLWEWSHRILGRFIGVFFVVPAALFCLRRGMTTPDTRKKLLAIAAGIGFQGFLGWYMVASGLKNPYENEPSSSFPRPDWTPRVDHFRLAAHLGTAFAVYMGMVYTAVSILRDNALVKNLKKTPEQATDLLTSFVHSLQNPKARTFRRVGLGMLVLACTTAIYGAFVAGLDAGLLYSEFPFMGGYRLLPPKDELLDPRYAFRMNANTEPDSSRFVLGNMTQNPVTVQAMHRYLGMTTFAAMFVFLAYAKRLKAHLPRAAPRFATGAAHMSALQALLGIFTLVYMVPVPLASLHQAGSVVLLTMLTCVMAVTKKPSKAIQLLAQTRRASQKMGSHP